MNQTRINPDLVSHIKICDKTQTDYVYKSKKVHKYLFGLYKEVEPAGYYTINLFCNEVLIFTIDEVKESVDVFDIDGVLYYKPCVEVFSGGKKIKTRYFNTLEEAKEYCDINFPNIKTVI